MSPTVILERETAHIAELRRKPFQIILDGSPAGTIDRNQTVELPVEPGPHTLVRRLCPMHETRRPAFQW